MLEIATECSIICPGNVKFKRGALMNRSLRAGLNQTMDLVHSACDLLWSNRMSFLQKKTQESSTQTSAMCDERLIRFHFHESKSWFCWTLIYVAEDEEEEEEGQTVIDTSSSGFNMNYVHLCNPHVSFAFTKHPQSSEHIIIFTAIRNYTCLRC